MKLTDFLAAGLLVAVLTSQYISEASFVQKGKFTFNFTSGNRYDCQNITFPRMFAGSDDVRVHVTLSHDTDDQRSHSSAVLWVQTITGQGFTVCTRETGTGYHGSSVVNWLAFQGNFSGIEHGIEEFDEFTARTICKKVKLSKVFSKVPRVFVTTFLPDSSGKNDALNLWIENITARAFHACVREFTNFDNIHENVKVQWFAVEENLPEDWNSTVTSQVIFPSNNVPLKKNGYALCKSVKFPDEMSEPPVILTSVNHNSVSTSTTPADCNTINTWIEEITHSYFVVCVKDLRGKSQGDTLAVDYTVLGDLDPCINVTCEHFAVCKPFAPNDPRCLCVEDCPSYEEQVCSSNATTFKNKCLFELEMCRLKSNHTLYHPGSCTGFPIQRGRVSLKQQPSYPETVCDTVRFSPYTFYPDALVYVQATVNHWNASDDNVHQAVEAWVEEVDHEKFTVCVTKTGRNDYQEIGFASVDWFAYQGAPPGGVADQTHIPEWWTGTKCKAINLPKNKFQGAPTVLVTAEHMRRGLKHDAASLWLEDITSTSFTVCLRELQNFDGLHADVQVNWLVFEDIPRPFVVERKSVYFPNNKSPTMNTNGAFCKDMSFSKKYDSAPSVILSINHTFSNGRLDPEYTGISSWIEYINTTGFRACLKQQHAKKYDPVTVSYVVLSDICGDEWDYFSGVCFYTSSSCKTWTESEKECRSEAANLVTVRNQEENVYVQHRHSGAKAWIGFNDKSFEGDFVWAASGVKANFTYWAKNQPNNLGNEDCVHTLGIHHDFTWNDVPCTDCHNYTCAKDLDECTTGHHACHSHATCSNSYGWFSCACNAGYSGDGRQLCTDINECRSSPCDANATCTNTAGSYICQCNKGFTGNGFTCQDIDECTTGSYNCDVNAYCTNTVGSYICTCNSLYAGNGKNCTAHRVLAGSSILNSLDHNKYLGKLLSFLNPVLMDSTRSRFVRCYRANTDGWSSYTFHSKCDGRGPTVTIVKVGNYIFGGYSNVAWHSLSSYSYANKAFIFSLYNSRGYNPVKLSQYRNKQCAIYGGSSYGPTFGGGHDIKIGRYANSYYGSYLNLGYTYQPPSGCSYSTSCSKTFLAGRYNNFYVTDYEVFYETTS